MSSQKRGFFRINTDAQKAPTGDEVLRVLLVDDGQPILDSFSQLVRPKRWEEVRQRNRHIKQNIDLRVYLMTGSNGLINKMNEWKREDKWEPNLILMDLMVNPHEENVGASNAGVVGRTWGHDYVKELTKDGRWEHVTIVMHTSSRCNSKDAQLMANSRADGYMWEKTASEDYLLACLAELPLFQMQTAFRVQRERSVRWAQFFAFASTHAAKSKDLSDAIAALNQEILPKLSNDLGVKHSFVRTRIGRGRYRLTARSNGDWARKHCEDISSLPLLKKTIELGEANFGSSPISESDAGIYPDLVGKYMLGASMRLEDGADPLGAINLVDESPFQSGDLQQLKYFATLIGGLLGRQKQIERRQLEQEVLNEFVQTLSHAHSELVICEQLASRVNEVVHDQAEEGECRKVTVRLVSPGTAKLVRIAAEGMVEREENIIINLKPSGQSEVPNISAVVRDGEMRYLADKESLHVKGYLKDSKWDSGCQLCVPLKIVTPVADDSSERRLGAIGTVNVENAQEHCYDDAGTRAWVESMAQIATAAIVRLRQQQAFDALSQLTLGGMENPSKQQWNLLNHAMAQYAGYGALKFLVPPADGHMLHDPWVVKLVLAGVTEGSAVSTNVDSWQKDINGGRIEAFIRRSIKGYLGGERGVAYSTTSSLVEDIFNGQDKAIVANAFVPWQKDGKLIGCWLLQWFSHPPLDREDLNLLSRFAEYAVVLTRLGTHWASREQQLEAADRLHNTVEGVQLFEHGLRNLLVELGNQVENVVYATELAQAKASAKALQVGLQEVGDKVRQQAKLLNQMEPTAISLAPIWNAAVQRLLSRARSLNVELRVWPELDVTGQQKVWADKNLIEVVFDILLQNSLEAFEGFDGDTHRAVWVEVGGVADGQVTFSVLDNGPGIPDDIRSNLGKKVVPSTKIRNAGVALYFVARRLDALLGGIDFPVAVQGSVVNIKLKIAK